jgi:hypothetical protein
VTAAVQALRIARVAAATAAATASGSATSSVASSADAGVEYIVPALAGLGREGVATVLPQVRHSVVHLVKCFVQTAYRAQAIYHILLNHAEQCNAIVSCVVSAASGYSSLELCTLQRSRGLRALQLSRHVCYAAWCCSAMTGCRCATAAVLY